MSIVVNEYGNLRADEEDSDALLQWAIRIMAESRSRAYEQCRFLVNDLRHDMPCDCDWCKALITVTGVVDRLISSYRVEVQP